MANLKKTRDYEDKVEHTKKVYEETAEHYESIRRDISELKDLTDFFINNLNGTKVLDIGCAGGRDAKYFSEIKKLDVTGIDFTEKFIQLSSLKAPKAKIIEMDMRKLKFKDEEFDGIWCCAAFLHIPKYQAKKTLQRFRRVLKQKGIMYISVKKGQGEKMISKEDYLNNEKFFAFYDLLEFEKLIKDSGFKIIKSFIEQRKDNIWINVFALKTEKQ